jgi:ribosomal protein S18 acetylase RimI-like enzyme
LVWEFYEKDCRAKKSAMKPFALRQEALLSDKEAVMEILLSTGAFGPHEVKVAVELVEDRLSKGDKSEYFFVFADISGETVGFVCYGPITITANGFDIYWIAVMAGMQGRGIGEALIKEAEKRLTAQGARVVFVETSSRDVYKGSMKFYLKQGYKEVSRVPDFYSDGDHKIILTKKITN